MIISGNLLLVETILIKLFIKSRRIYRMAINTARVKSSKKKLSNSRRQET
jgi:hypothetical protein